MLRTTPHPDWVIAFREFIKPYERRVTDSQIFKDLSRGRLTRRRLEGGLINFYPLIESFPKYMALSLAKVPAGNAPWNRKARYWLITNINQERIHTSWWKQWACGSGIAPSTFDKEIYPPPEMDALNNYLWRVCTYGSLAEAISAANFAVEGPTGVWTRAVAAGLERQYRGDGTADAGKTLEWVTGHARYDDRHPEEALEIIKAFAGTEEEQEKVRQAAKRSLEYYAMSLEACYDIFR